MKVDVIMPQMGESIAEGTVLRYLKKVGESVKRDEDILEISTDKVDATVPSPASGVLAEILVPEGKTVEINAVLARVETEAGAALSTPAAASVQAPSPAPQQPPASRPAQTSPPAAPPMAAPAPSHGRALSSADLSAQRRAGQIPTKEELRRVRSTPLVRRIAAEHGVDISHLQGSGISGRVTRNDIMAHLDAGGAGAAVMPATAAPSHASAAAPASPAIAYAPGEDVRVEPLTNIRKIIAEHMIVSRRTSAHVHTVYEVDMTKVVKLREKHKATFEAREGIKLTYTPFVIKAAIEGLKAFPAVNASIDGNSVVYHRRVHFGVAVALDWGLIVPVIRNADEKNLLGIARSVNDLGTRARTRKLGPDEIQGSTFTLTNPGAFGGLYGMPIINQPNVAILGIGVIQKRPVVIDDAIAIRSMMYMVLGYDHRLVDGAVAEQFLSHVKGTLERGTFTDLS
ncbi:MAG: 2-oxoglutarate dehydrogenase, E2 component, dihydrolipoamide succinyltransferase [Acidobacteria bacterium]|nr:2-oxoglutarate dehydrogenase, E2 component, dihydrolipoamide succinyltransferase [Acidobacteriota bacterium]